MANDITGNPWSLDTPALNLWPAQVFIRNLVWADAADGDQLLIQDNVGRDILKAIFVAAGDQNYGPFQWVEGVNVITLTGGIIFVVVHK